MVDAWHSTLRMVYHTSRKCAEARNIPDAYRREGRGAGRILCTSCLILQAKERRTLGPENARWEENPFGVILRDGEEIII